MIYQAFEAQMAIVDLMRPFAAMAATTLRLPWPGALPLSMGGIAGDLEAFAGLRVTATRRSFAIEPIAVGNALVAVEEEIVATTAFATLLRFKKDLAAEQPKVLLVAPMSGHFATLLRATVQTMLIDHDVYITDWHNIRDIPAEAGRFDFSTYVEEIIHFLRVLGEGTHLMAVCQPAVPALAAAALMAEDGDPALPRSLVLMAGPIDTRVSPTAVNKLAGERPIEWFEQNLTDKVPPGYKGAGRRVYPGFVQLSAFLSMNLDRHKAAFADMSRALAEGDTARYARLQTFYEEYLAVMDLAAEFYLETVQLVFQEHALPKGELRVSGRPIAPRAIRRLSLLTVEGERDDICGLGQTMAAQDLCTGVRQYRKTHHVQTGVGHYGVFSGRRWTGEIYPIVRDTIAMAH